MSIVVLVNLERPGATVAFASAAPGFQYWMTCDDVYWSHGQTRKFSPFFAGATCMTGCMTELTGIDAIVDTAGIIGKRSIIVFAP